MKTNLPRSIPAISVLTWCAWVIMGCAGAAVRYDRAALDRGFVREEIVGPRHVQAVYWSRRPKGAEPLHVYLEGDGVPWLSPRRTAMDPTPRGDLIQSLMARDPAPAVIVGRPCHHGYADAPPCHVSLWTQERYSNEIVDSFLSTLETIRRRHPRSPITLIGFSGGGTLAMLIAGRTQVEAVVTLAANLDIERWTAHHGFAPLRGSINPAREPPLSPIVRQLHLAGSHDKTVPPHVGAPRDTTAPNVRFEVIDGFDHRCCWTRIWPEALEKLPP